MWVRCIDAGSDDSEVVTYKPVFELVGHFEMSVDEGRTKDLTFIFCVADNSFKQVRVSLPNIIPTLFNMPMSNNLNMVMKRTIARRAM